ncbi:hypothetical protein [Azospirillum melinis]
MKAAWFGGFSALWLCCTGPCLRVFPTVRGSNPQPRQIPLLTFSALFLTAQMNAMTALHRHGRFT